MKPEDGGEWRRQTQTREALALLRRIPACCEVRNSGNSAHRRLHFSPIPNPSLNTIPISIPIPIPIPRPPPPQPAFSNTGQPPSPHIPFPSNCLPFCLGAAPAFPNAIAKNAPMLGDVESSDIIGWAKI
ncbi:uncharacterized protein MYCFIDRAFT_207048 [Pseudocercospora fijiensis CIRAD86]|uniref:Uncharacterized protein n=1 Tax=Pseudocercospora fijiensis (strain CIRAD86) TaxID=383855 RepID=M2Z1R3_PSEFD|nr:uncharacterized protein MYCFIDRAFT_207048 [Pseudocercospora fijiensis CIRAD86]EME83745.1 hypothetical protein MYCFIDRAFT_207048 [Pseudocercospora fijiensis CIRAD86]